MLLSERTGVLPLPALALPSLPSLSFHIQTFLPLVGPWAQALLR